MVSKLMRCKYVDARNAETTRFGRSLLMVNILYLLPKMTEMRDEEPSAVQMIPLKCLILAMLKVFCHI